MKIVYAIIELHSKIKKEVFRETTKILTELYGFRLDYLKNGAPCSGYHSLLSRGECAATQYQKVSTLQFIPIECQLWARVGSGEEIIIACTHYAPAMLVVVPT